MSRKFVVSGGPCSGKTTLIKELEKQGFAVFHEAAREIIKNQENNDKTQYKIFEKQMSQLKEADNAKEKIIFFDRGIPDSLAYFKYNNFKIPQKILKESKKDKTQYELIFILERLPLIDDGFRIEKSDENAETIHKIIYETYNSLGYNIIKVPLMSIEKRIEFLKKYL